MSELSKRVVSAVILAAAYIFVISIDVKFNFYHIPIFLYLSFFAVLLYRETSFVFSKKYQRHIVIEYITTTLGILYLVLTYLKSYPILSSITNNSLLLHLERTLKDSNLLPFFLLLLILISIIYFVLIKYQESNMFYLMENLFFFIYAYFFTSHLLLVHSLESGTFYVWIVSWAIIMSDISAYFVGKYFGKHKIGFTLSPNKTYEGYILGALLQLIINLIYYNVARQFFDVPYLSVLELIIYSSVIFVFSAIGDLGESLWKRSHKVKDSGTLMPGHGGIFDTLDALLLTIPVFYYTYHVILFFKQI